MERPDEDQAVELLGTAQRTGVRLAALPPASLPKTPAEALAIQDRLVAGSGKTVAGWKVSTTAEGVATYGTIYDDDRYTSPAAVPADRYRMAGIEGEVAFRFRADLPRGPALTQDAIVNVLEPFPAIEIVDSRFADYGATPVLARLADRMSNGGVVVGAASGHPADLSALKVRLSVDGTAVVERTGGHARGNPLLPALEFINAMRPRFDFRAGQFIIAGTLTGMRPGKRGQTVDLRFEGLGEVRLRFS